MIIDMVVMTCDIVSMVNEVDRVKLVLYLNRI